MEPGRGLDFDYGAMGSFFCDWSQFLVGLFCPVRWHPPLIVAGNKILDFELKSESDYVILLFLSFVVFFICVCIFFHKCLIRIRRN